ncbi:MAG: Flp family type IVb pilin, partial [Deltaproteobacteria bacterium]|nr:Flp family type IVb pilin [Deltaproteobacteria bacterium]
GDRRVPRWKREDGVTSMEYGLIGLLIAIAIIVALTNIGVSLGGFFEAAQQGFASAGN